MILIKQLLLINLRQNIALVSQDIYLFHGSIRENIAYGSHTTQSMSDLVNAAKMAELHDFIESCPDVMIVSLVKKELNFLVANDND